MFCGQIGYNFGSFNPSSLPNLWQWVEGSNVTTSSSNVVAWPDLSSSNNPYTGKGTFTNYPVVGTIAGLPGVQFNNNNACLLSTAVLPSVFLTPGCSVFAVVNFISEAVSYSRIVSHYYVNSWALTLSNDFTAAKWIVADDTFPYGTVEGPDASLAIGTTYLIAGIYDPTVSSGTGYLRVNGVQQASGVYTSPGSSFSSNVSVGNDSESGGAQLNATIGEVAIYTDVVSGGNLTKLENYFLTKYGI